MAPLDWQVLLSQAPSIGIAVAFGFFILRFLDRQDKQLDAASAKAAEERLSRDEGWRQFLKEEREARTVLGNATLTQLSQLSSLVTATNLLITQHDIWQRAFNERKDKP